MVTACKHGNPVGLDADGRTHRVCTACDAEVQTPREAFDARTNRQWLPVYSKGDVRETGPGIAALPERRPERRPEPLAFLDEELLCADE